MKQRQAFRIYIHNGGLANREKPVHLVVIACCTELKDGRVIVDDLGCGLIRVDKEGWIIEGQNTILVVTYPGIPGLLRNQYVVDQERGCICNLSGLMGELPNPRVMVI